MLTLNKNKELLKNLLIYLSFITISVGILYLLFFGETILHGDDGLFHKARIENLYLSIKDGVYFPKINYELVNDFGYASSIFYNDFFLYIPAILRLTGMSLSNVYTFLFVLINISTFSIAYEFGKKMFNKVNSAYLFSLLYTLSTYRIHILFKRAAVGEVIALAFLPIVLYGIYQVLYKNSKNWKYLTLGMSGVVLSHLLTTLMASTFIVILVLLNIKQLLSERERLYSLIKATMLTLLVTSFSLFPILEQLRYQDLKVKTDPLFNVDEQTVSLWNLFYDNVISNPYSVILGIIPLTMLIIYLFKWKKLDKISKDFLVVSVFSSFISLSILPTHLLVGTPFNSLQFLTRFYGVASLFIYYLVSKDELKLLNNLVLTIMLLITTYQIGTVEVIWQLRSDVGAGLPKEEFNDPNIYKIGDGEEYLPTGTTLKFYEESKLTEVKGITNYNKERDSVSFDYNFSKPTKVVLPFINYKGYKAINNGKEETLTTSEKYKLIEVELDGTVNFIVFYEGTILQKTTFLLSVLTLLAWLLYEIKERRGLYRGIKIKEGTVQ